MVLLKIHRITTNIQVLCNSITKSIVKSIDSYITPEIKEEFIPNHYSSEKKKELQSYYKLYNKCNCNELKLATINMMQRAGFEIEALNLLELHHS